MSLGALVNAPYMVIEGKSRSISGENPKGEKGGACREFDPSIPWGEHFGDERHQWKARPCIGLKAGEETTLGDITESGLIQRMWFTIDFSRPEAWRDIVLRMYWDGEENASVEVPIGDFFFQGWCRPALVNSQYVQVTPKCGFNSSWPMPFREGARITVENQSGEDVKRFFYQINYSLRVIPGDAMYFHAQWRRENPLREPGTFTMLDDVKGKGNFLGFYLSIGTDIGRWWGEGEVKFFLDGDRENPTVCTTGTEDVVGGSYCFLVPVAESPENVQIATYSYPSFGYIQCLSKDGAPYEVPGKWPDIFARANRHGLYRLYGDDPISFEGDLRITIQALSMDTSNKPSRYIKESYDMAATTFWYQAEEHAQFPELPNRDARAVHFD